MYLKKKSFMSEVTKKAIDDFNRLDDRQFMRKYFCHKLTYAKRVAKYGDPYMKSPLAKLGKLLSRIQSMTLKSIRSKRD
jgi:hypothetical protein